MTNATDVAADTSSRPAEAAGTAAVPSGVFDQLVAEHAEMIALLEKIVDSDDPSSQLALYHDLRRVWLAHAYAEKDQVYPQVERLIAPDHKAHALIDECLDEHQQIEEAIDEISQMEAGEPEWIAAFDDLQRIFEEHVEREQGELFFSVEPSIGEREASAILGDYQTLRAQCLSR